MNGTTNTRTWQRGDKVICNGNVESVVIGATAGVPGMYDVRLWDGSRHIGDVTVAGSELLDAND
jgi:hypothetical protein